MTGDVSNEGWQSYEPGVYYYDISAVGYFPTNGQILFTGVFDSDTSHTNTNYSYNISLRTGYDIDETNNVLVGTYKWTSISISAGGGG